MATLLLFIMITAYYPFSKPFQYAKAYFVKEDGIGGVEDGIRVERQPMGLAVNSLTNNIYVANSGSNTVSLLDGENDKLIANLTVGSNPFSVAVNPVTDLVYVANNGDNTTSVIDGKTNKVIA